MDCGLKGWINSIKCNRKTRGLSKSGKASSCKISIWTTGNYNNQYLCMKTWQAAIRHQGRTTCYEYGLWVRMREWKRSVQDSYLTGRAQCVDLHNSPRAWALHRSFWIWRRPFALLLFLWLTCVTSDLRFSACHQGGTSVLTRPLLSPVFQPHRRSEGVSCIMQNPAPVPAAERGLHTGRGDTCDCKATCSKMKKYADTYSGVCIP